MRAPQQPMFLARQTYRRRRLMDAARLLPFLGIGFFALPVLWEDGAETSEAVVYIFLAWAALIVLAALLARRLNRMPSDDDGGGES